MPGMLLNTSLLFSVSEGITLRLSGFLVCSTLVELTCELCTQDSQNIFLIFGLKVNSFLLRASFSDFCLSIFCCFY